ncbi:hypothetical protein FRX31_033122 [Thalictrum thalictroides]|uniref:Uncharacterized protein n=1 Tax=Thalictrum thalictroides TaxID=46969 RepID=A0A7J6UXU3_THATH|nr:hypothetical protein FRX31_033122 [Thalictrum thalictroides]
MAITEETKEYFSDLLKGFTNNLTKEFRAQFGSHEASTDTKIKDMRTIMEKLIYDKINAAFIKEGKKPMLNLQPIQPQTSNNTNNRAQSNLSLPLPIILKLHIHKQPLELDSDDKAENIFVQTPQRSLQEQTYDKGDYKVKADLPSFNECSSYRAQYYGKAYNNNPPPSFVDFSSSLPFSNSANDVGYSTLPSLPYPQLFPTPSQPPIPSSSNTSSIYPSKQNNPPPHNNPNDQPQPSNYKLKIPSHNTHPKPRSTNPYICLSSIICYRCSKPVHSSHE